jgi:hypothetical protein
VDDWFSEMADLGWSVLEVGDNFALLRTVEMDSWTQIASRRIGGMMKRVRVGDPDVFNEMSFEIDFPDVNDTDNEMSDFDFSNNE